MNKFLTTVALATVFSVTANAQTMQVELPPCQSLPCPSGVAPPSKEALAKRREEVLAKQREAVLAKQREDIFSYVTLLLHETNCPMQRSAAFQSARSTMLGEAKQKLADVPESVMARTAYFNIYEEPTTRGLWCRTVTEQITGVQRMMFE
jgi:hypothetical protein